jgi:hypothetical protein
VKLFGWEIKKIPSTAKVHGEALEALKELHYTMACWASTLNSTDKWDAFEGRALQLESLCRDNDIDISTVVPWSIQRRKRFPKGLPGERRGKGVA